MSDVREVDINTILDDPPTAQCSDCGRKSWHVGEPYACGMIQPNGTYCRGSMRAIECDGAQP